MGRYRNRKDTLEPLIGAPVDPQVYKQISDFVEKHDGILEVMFDLIITDQEGAWHPIHAEGPE